MLGCFDVEMGRPYRIGVVILTVAVVMMVTGFLRQDKWMSNSGLALLMVAFAFILYDVFKHAEVHAEHLAWR